MAKRKSRTYGEKLKILQFVEENRAMKRRDIAEKFSIKPQTLSDLIKNSDKIKANMEIRKGQSASSLKRARLISYQDVDTALITWFRQHSESPNFWFDGSMLKKKANNFARAFGKDTKVTSSWINRWKKRWGIGRINKVGECGGVNDVTVKEWQNTGLENILEKYEPNNIYNTGEARLFWQMLPENDNDDVDEAESIPTTEQAIQAIDCIRRFTLSMDDISITEDVLRLTTILERKLMQEKVSKSKQTIITQYFRFKDM